MGSAQRTQTPVNPLKWECRETRGNGGNGGNGGGGAPRPTTCGPETGAGREEVRETGRLGERGEGEREGMRRGSEERERGEGAFVGRACGSWGRGGGRTKGRGGMRWALPSTTRFFPLLSFPPLPSSSLLSNGPSTLPPFLSLARLVSPPPYETCAPLSTLPRPFSPFLSFVPLVPLVPLRLFLFSLSLRRAVARVCFFVRERQTGQAQSRERATGRGHQTHGDGPNASRTRCEVARRTKMQHSARATFAAPTQCTKLPRNPPKQHSPPSLPFLSFFLFYPLHHLPPSLSLVRFPFLCSLLCLLARKK